MKPSLFLCSLQCSLLSLSFLLCIPPFFFACYLIPSRPVLIIYFIFLSYLSWPGIQGECAGSAGSSTLFGAFLAWYQTLVNKAALFSTFHCQILILSLLLQQLNTHTTEFIMKIHHYFLHSTYLCHYRDLYYLFCTLMVSQGCTAHMRQVVHPECVASSS